MEGDVLSKTGTSLNRDAGPQIKQTRMTTDEKWQVQARIPRKPVWQRMVLYVLVTDLYETRQREDCVEVCPSAICRM